MGKFNFSTPKKTVQGCVFWMRMGRVKVYVWWHTDGDYNWEREISTSILPLCWINGRHRQPIVTKRTQTHTTTTACANIVRAIEVLKNQDKDGTQTDMRASTHVTGAFLQCWGMCSASVVTCCTGKVASAVYDSAHLAAWAGCAFDDLSGGHRECEFSASRWSRPSFE